MTNHNQNPSSRAISGSSGLTNSGGGKSRDILTRCLDLLEDLVVEAVGVEYCLNPSEYVISAEIVQKANQILADSSDIGSQIECGEERDETD